MSHQVLLAVSLLCGGRLMHAFGKRAGGDEIIKVMSREAWPVTTGIQWYSCYLVIHEVRYLIYQKLLEYVVSFEYGFLIWVGLLKIKYVS